MIPNPNYEKDTDRFLEYAKEMWKAGVISEKRFRISRNTGEMLKCCFLGLSRSRRYNSDT